LDWPRGKPHGGRFPTPAATTSVALVGKIVCFAHLDLFADELPTKQLQAFDKYYEISCKFLMRNLPDLWLP
jgi:hypothetical protein